MWLVLVGITSVGGWILHQTFAGIDKVEDDVRAKIADHEARLRALELETYSRKMTPPFVWPPRGPQ